MGVLLASTGALAGSVPILVRPDPGTAREWLGRELARPEYQQGLVERFLGWVQGLWSDLTRSALAATPLSTAAATLVLVVLVGLALLVVARVRRDPSTRSAGPELLVPGQVLPHEHRSSAETALHAGAFDTAVVEAFRALAARAVERGHAPNRPGMTAHELVAGLAPAFASHADDLHRSSTLFDQVFYGRQPATEADARSVLALEERLRTARPGLPSAGVPVRPDAAVPR